MSACTSLSARSSGFRGTTLEQRGLKGRKAPRSGRLAVSAIGGLFGGKKNEDKMCRDMVNDVKEDFVSEGKVYKVTFQGKGDDTRVIECRDDQYILDAADENGIDLPATCRGGICGACVAKCTAGVVDQSDIDDLSFTMDEDEIAQGMTLICMARPKGDVTLETQCDWGYSLGVAEWKANGEFEARPDPLMGNSWEEEQVEANS